MTRTRKKSAKKRTLYDARYLESRLAQLPPAFRDLFRDAYIGARKLRARADDAVAPPGLMDMVDRRCGEWSLHARPACSEGCAWCCMQDVLMAPFEFDAVREAIDSAGLGDRVRRNLAASDTGPTIHVDGRDLPVSPCPLLDDEHRCMIYTARPLACRTQFAMHAEKCQNAFEAARDGNADASYPRAGDPAVIGIAAREAMQANRRVFLRDQLRAHL